MTADLFDDRLKFYACLVGRDQAHEAVEPPVQISLVDLERAVVRASRRRPMAQARLSKPFRPGANTASPESIAY